MSLARFSTSASGRLANVTLGFALLSAGALALRSPAHPDAIIGAILLFCAIGSIVSVGLAVNDHGWHAFAMILGLPLLAGPYVAGLFLAAGAGPKVGLPLIVAGAVATWIAALGHRVIARAGQAAALQT